jgi:hypothetical protein
MSTQISATLPSLPGAFAAACRQARSDSELFERCRDVLVSRFESEGIWFSINQTGASPRRVGGGEGFGNAA